MLFLRKKSLNLYCFVFLSRFSFGGEESESLDPKCGILSVADRTAKRIGHLIAVSMCHGGPGPGFLVPSIYRFTACGLQEVLKDLLQTLSTGSLYCDIFKKTKSCN